MHQPTHREGTRLKLNDTLIETLSRNFARSFLRSLPSHTHLQDDLQQEAAIAIVACAARFNEANPSFQHYAYVYARKAMQKLCSEQAGPVRKSWGDGRDFAGSKYGDDFPTIACADFERPDHQYERREANEIVHDLVDRRAQLFSGKGKLDRPTIKRALTDMISGDTCLEVAKRYGCSKQRMHMLAAQAGIS